MRSSSTVILGGGLSGISLAYFLKGRDLAVFEKEKQPGGLCRSLEIGGFIFDYDGHLLHARTSFFRNFVKKILRKELIEKRRKARVYFRKEFLDYPFQRHFPYKSPSLVGKEKDFRSWCQMRFSPSAFRYFLSPYNKKFWQVSLEDLSFGWAERFVPQNNNLKGYNDKFFYPKKGMQSFVYALLKSFNFELNLGFEAEEIDLKNNLVKFSNGFTVSYRRLFSSLPLIELVKITKGIPERIKSLAKKLQYNSIYVLNLGIKGNLSRWGHWIYFPQKNISFFRVGFPSNFSSLIAPKGCSSLYAEVSVNPYQLVDNLYLEKRIISDLSRLGIVTDKDIVEKIGIFIKYAYPLPLRGKDEIVNQVEEFLKKYNIYLMGRYGRWEYMSMEDVVLESKSLAAII